MLHRHAIADTRVLFLVRTSGLRVSRYHICQRGPDQLNAHLRVKST